jgi:hypothetical protein
MVTIMAITSPTVAGIVVTVRTDGEHGRLARFDRARGPFTGRRGHYPDAGAVRGQYLDASLAPFIGSCHSTGAEK